MTRLLSAVGLWAVLGAFVFGAGWAVVAPASPAQATDNATYLGVVEVDCRSGRLLPQTIVFSGGVGDTFKFLSSSGNCGVADSQNILTGEANLVAGVVSAALTITDAGEFTVTDAGSNAVTFTIHAGPVFGNHGRGTLPEQTVEITCNGSSSDFESEVTIYYQATNDTFKLKNESSSKNCSSFADGSNILTNEPANLSSGATSGSITITGSGTFTATTNNTIPRTITFTVVEGKQPDIGVGADEG